MADNYFLHFSVYFMFAKSFDGWQPMATSTLLRVAFLDARSADDTANIEIRWWKSDSHATRFLAGEKMSFRSETSGKCLISSHRHVGVVCLDDSGWNLKDYSGRECFAIVSMLEPTLEFFLSLHQVQLKLRLLDKVCKVLNPFRIATLRVVI